jgi:hypothetical protein
MRARFRITSDEGSLYKADTMSFENRLLPTGLVRFSNSDSLLTVRTTLHRNSAQPKSHSNTLNSIRSRRTP